MYDYLVEKGDVGSYKSTYEHTLSIFASKNPEMMAIKSGINFDRNKSCFSLQSLGQKMIVAFPEGRVLFDESTLTPLWPWCLIILNHLARADDTPLPENVISFREADGGNIFYSAFYKMNITPIINKISDKPAENIKSVCCKLGAKLSEGADVCAIFDFLPRFPVTLKIWLSDDEMDGSANLLFNSSANHYLHTEDIVVASSILVNSLIKQYELTYP